MKTFLVEHVILISTISIVCGNMKMRPQFDGRIVGGENTTIEEYPYQVSLENSMGHYCGGAILTPDIIITAAHCVSLPEKQILVRAGTTIREIGGTVHNVRKIIRHNGTTDSNFDNDVALIVLGTPVELSQQIQPIPLPEETEYLNENELVTVTGWGYLNPGGFLPKILQKVEIPIVNQLECVQAYSSIGPITPNMLCAGLYDVGGKDACQGDSGGPLTANRKLHGITSWGYGCADRHFPGVFVRVTAIREWIRFHAHI